MNGKTFGGRYTIQEKIGSGGMAEVYRAHDTTLNRTVAVKVLYPHYANEADFVARFRREAQAAANLNHPNIVNIYDWGSEDSTYYIVMEYLVGQNLKEIIMERAPLSEALIIDIGRQVAAALGYAHRHNLVHRDIKPHNIVITEDGEVKVTDFGIARSTTSTMTQTGSIMGTAHYLSPEQAQGNEVGSVSDLYSLGIVLFEMATGKVPFEGDSPVAIAMKHVHETPVSPQRLNPDLPPNLTAVILKAIAKNPSDRYQSAEEMREDLGRCAEGLSIAPVSPGGESTIVIPRVPAGTEPARSPRDTNRPQRKSRGWIIALVIAAILLIGGTAAALMYMNATTVSVPKVVNLSETGAKKILAKKDLKLAVADSVFNSQVDPGKIISQNPAAGSKARTGSLIKVVLSKGKEKVAIPKLTGLSLDQATFFLAKANLNVGDINRVYSDRAGDGTVTNQDPQAGSKVFKGTTVNLEVSKGSKPIRVPDVVGKTSAEAEATIGQLGLTPDKSQEFSATVDDGKVIRQSPPAGTVIDNGGTVSIVVSKGPEMVGMPNVTGLAQDEATTKLQDLGFVVQVKTGISTADNIGKVVSQSPDTGQQARKGSTATIWVGQKPTP